MNEREQIFEWLNSCPVKWEINFDDFELLSINLVYVEEDTDNESSSN